MDELFTNNPEQIKQIQLELIQIADFDKRIPKVSETGKCDDATIKALKAFQKVYALDETGVVDYNTWVNIQRVYKFYSKPSEELIGFPNKARVYKLNSEGPTVYLTQVILRILSEKYINLPKVDITGVYDQKTFNAVKAFQDKTLLISSGELGATTWEDLAYAFNSLME